MARLFIRPDNCKIAGPDFNLLCHFHKIKSQTSFDYGTDNVKEIPFSTESEGNEDDLIADRMVGRNSREGFFRRLPDKNRRFRRLNCGNTRAKHTGTRIGKRSESLDWNSHGRL